MRIELKIDGQRVKINQKTNIAVTHSIADVQEPESTLAGYSKSVEVPLIPHNMRIFRFTNELFSKEQFNNEQHPAAYLVDGITVMTGVAQIDKITYKFGHGRKLTGGSFHVSVIGAAFEWISHAKKPMNELRSDQTVTYDMQEVYRNSIQEQASLVKFLPVDRGAFYRLAEDAHGNKLPRTKLALFDYHPFFNVWKTLELIFGGWVVHSSMRDLFEKLYCSGYMPEADNADDANVVDACDFSCGDDSGKDFVNPNMVLNVLNSWSEADGFNGNGVLETISSPFDSWETHGFTCYRPPVKVNVRFHLQMSVSVAVRSGGPADLNYVDKMLFGARNPDGGNEYEHTLKFEVDESEEYKEIEKLTPYTDLQAGRYLFRISGKDLSQYTSLEFTSADIVTYRHVGRPDKYVSSWGSLRLPGGKVTLELTRSDGKKLNPYTMSTFKIELVYLPEERLTFKVDYTTNPVTCGPDEVYLFPFRFVRDWDATIVSNDDVIYGPARLEPVFGSFIPEGAAVGISTIGGTGSQLDFLASIRQLFNLMFYTNPLSREVYIEPRPRFYNLDRAAIIDWRGKIDYSQQMDVEELGADAGNAIKLAYAEGNEVVQYHNWKNRTQLASYSEGLQNKTADETKELINPTFAPFLLRKVESVGMTLLQEQRESTKETIDDVELDITPVVGYFKGVAERTAGDDRSQYPRYPQLVFQDAAGGINLGFEDITGNATLVPGLRHYYADNISAYNSGRRITLYLQLTPADIEAIQFPNRQMQDFRAVFLLNFDGEDVPCLLESIEDYNPAGGTSTKCVFVSDPHLKLTGSDLVVITYDGVAVSRNNALIGYKG